VALFIGANIGKRDRTLRPFIFPCTPAQFLFMFLNFLNFFIFLIFLCINIKNKFKKILFNIFLKKKTSRLKIP
jgi:hypothetical protein